jgi:hypothetical protein
MLKIKSILPVFAALCILGLSNAAFAQLSCNVASTPVSRATDTGYTEPAGDLIFNCANGGTPTTTATMTIDYGVPITNSIAYPAGRPISVTVPAGSGFAIDGGPPSIGPTGVVNTTGQIVVSIPPQSLMGGPVYSFTVTGVLLGLADTGKTSVTANVSVSPGSNVLITAGQTNAVVVTSVLAGIQAPRITATTVAGTILTAGTMVTPGFSVDVPENYIDAFRGTTQFNSGASTQGVQLLFTFAGIPTGVSLTGCTANLVNPTTTPPTLTPLTVPATLTSTTNTATVEITTADLTVAESVRVACTGFAQGTATLPYAPGTVTVTVTLAPTGAALGTGGVVLTTATTGQIPRYKSNPLPSPALTVINIIPATTNILVPFVSVGNGFDTGFSFANTTADPYGLTAGGARGQSGTIAVYFFPTTGNPFCVVTGGTATLPASGGTGATNCTTLTAVGQGSGTGGTIAAGASWVVLGSDIFKQVTGAPAAFNGYAFAIANFTNAHVTAFVADAAFSGKFASGGPALVLPNPSIVSRTLTVAGGVVESLGH